MKQVVALVLLGLAGAAGTLLRAGCTAVAVRLCGPAFPWGTLAVNVAGSFAFGAIYSSVRSRSLPTEFDSVLLVGLLGGFTTYSSFAFQSVEMAESGRGSAAAAYVAATTLLGLAAAWCGLRCFR
ncbi:MAG: fluoride efflux transporter FluC [Planctomycetaceae bacterium]